VPLLALTRPVPAALDRCELTHLARVPIDVDRAAAQHAGYERVLASLGCIVRRVPPAHDLPDSVFIEDTAVVLDEVAIVARPGAASRRGEADAVADVLAEYRHLGRITAPATIDGGDVLRLGRTLYVGTGGRTNAGGVAQLAAIAGPLGYAVAGVQVNGCLHLKSAVTECAPGLLVVNPEWVDAGIFAGHRAIDVDPGEPSAANVLRVGAVVVCAAAHARTRARLEAAGLCVRPVDVSELAKAEAGVTCCSILLNG
jgi:dimethylargininase